MAEFSSLDSNQPNIPLNPGDSSYGLGDLTNPDNVLSGQLRGSQYVGSPSLQIDSTNNLINIKGANALSNSVVKYGEIDSTHLGLAVNDGTNDIMFAGQDSTTTPATTYVKIAKTGFDAKTATGSNLVFNSNQDILKVVLTGTAVINVPSSTNDFAQLTTINHNLGFKPAVLAYMLPPVTYATGINNVPLPFFDYTLFDSSNAANIRGWHINGLGDITSISETIVTFRLAFVNNFSSYIGNWTFKYYLLQESITVT